MDATFAPITTARFFESVMAAIWDMDVTVDCNHADQLYDAVITPGSDGTPDIRCHDAVEVAKRIFHGTVEDNPSTQFEEDALRVTFPDKSGAILYKSGNGIDSVIDNIEA